MKLKAFRLEQGKLCYIDTREAREGDIIVTGETSVANLSEVQLREATTSDFPGLMGSGPTKQESQRARLDRVEKTMAAEKLKTAEYAKDVDKTVAAIKAKTSAINRANPTLQAEQARELEASIRKYRPEYTAEQIQTFLRGK